MLVLQNWFCLSFFAVGFGMKLVLFMSLDLVLLDARCTADSVTQDTREEDKTTYFAYRRRGSLESRLLFYYGAKKIVVESQASLESRRGAS